MSHQDTSFQAPCPIPKLPGRPSGKRRNRIIFGACALFILVGAICVLSGLHGTAAVLGKPDGAHLPVVAVEKIRRQDLSQRLSVSAEFLPYQRVLLHAKIAGYLQGIWVDVGDQVVEGQAVAQLDVPEMQEDLRKAAAALGVSIQQVSLAEANHAEAHLGFERLQKVAEGNPKFVAQQELDASTARNEVTSSAVAEAKQKVESAQAEVSRVKAMIGYTTITAPFDGIVTRRLADPGALIQAGTAANTEPLVEIEQSRKLKLVFAVPESAVPLVKVGAVVRVTVGTLGETFEAAVSRYSGKVDRATRTMSTEVDVDNPQGRLKPGMIAEVGLSLRESKGAVAVPVQALSVGEKPSVLLVGPGEAIERRVVRLGLETAAMVEVLEGLEPGDRVLVGTRNGIQPGQKVAARLLEPASE